MTLAQVFIIGMGAGGLFILVRDISLCLSTNAKGQVFGIARYISGAVIGGITGVAVNLLWHL